MVDTQNRGKTKVGTMVASRRRPQDRSKPGRAVQMPQSPRKEIAVLWVRLAACRKSEPLDSDFTSWLWILIDLLLAPCCTNLHWFFGRFLRQWALCEWLECRWICLCLYSAQWLLMQLTTESVSSHKLRSPEWPGSSRWSGGSQTGSSA